MKNYWLLSTKPHGDEFLRSLQTQSAMIDRVPLDERVAVGDIVYLYNPEQDALFGWGYLSEKRETESPNVCSITISGGKIQNFLTPANGLKQNELIGPLLKTSVGATSFLVHTQIDELDKQMSFIGPKPPNPRMKHFVLDSVVKEDEGLYVEYKLVKFSQIVKKAKPYAIAFVKGDGGRIYFGIRDSDRKVVGLQLNHRQRDELTQNFDKMLSQINTPLRAGSDYFLTFHPVVDEHGHEKNDLFVFEMEVRGTNEHRHTSSSGKIFEKTYSGRREIKE